MDPNAVAGMIFTLVLTLFIGGFILLYPLSRRLGALIDARLAEKDRKLQAGAAPAPQVAQQLAAMVESIHALEEEVRQLAERQEFAERLLSERAQEPALPPETRQT